MAKSSMPAILIMLIIAMGDPLPATGSRGQMAYDEGLAAFTSGSAGGPQLSQVIPDFGPDGLKGLTEEQKKKILSGEVVLVSSHEGAPEGKSIISAVLVFEVPVERAWAILSAPELQAEYLEEIEEPEDRGAGA